MGKRSGITKGGRVMNPADRERKQQRAKELKRNKKQRTAVRQAIVKSRDPEEIIEQMSRLDDQEFDTQRQLSLNVIQEKRHKLRGTFIQIINLTRQEKEDRKTKDLERMMYEYEIERRKKEESYRAMMFSENSNFDEIPLPSGLSAPDAASTPFVNNIGGFDIGPQMPVQLQAALKAGILKKSTVVSVRKKHKYPPGPPPGLPFSLFESEDDDENEQDEQNTREDYRRRNKRVRFGERISQFEDDEKIPERREQDEEEIDEDYAPVEIPESMLATDKQSQQQLSQSVSLRQIPSLSAPQVGFGPIQPSIVLPSQHPHYPAYPIQPGYIMRVGPSGPGQMPYPFGSESSFSASMMHTRSGIVSGNNYSSSAAPPDPHPSAIISAEPQVVKPNVNIVPRNQNTVTGESFSAAPQMRDIKREATRFVPTAVKIHRPVVPTQTSIGPRLPTASTSGLGAGATRLMPRTATTSSVVRSISGKTKTTRTMGVVAHQKPAKSVDEACDEFLNELQGLL